MAYLYNNNMSAFIRITILMNEQSISFRLLASDNVGLFSKYIFSIRVFSLKILFCVVMMVYYFINWSGGGRNRCRLGFCPRKNIRQNLKTDWINSANESNVNFHFIGFISWYLIWLKYYSGICIIKLPTQFCWMFSITKNRY